MADRYTDEPLDIAETTDQSEQNVYRPCCNNPTHFPDCNHGMAMLGLLTLRERPTYLFRVHDLRWTIKRSTR